MPTFQSESLQNLKYLSTLSSPSDSPVAITANSLGAFLSGPGLSKLTGGSISVKPIDLWAPTTPRTVVTHKGTDVYDVLWSVDVTTSLDLRRPSVDDILHVEAVWEAKA